MEIEMHASFWRASFKLLEYLLFKIKTTVADQVVIELYAWTDQ